MNLTSSLESKVVYANVACGPALYQIDPSTIISAVIEYPATYVCTAVRINERHFHSTRICIIPYKLTPEKVSVRLLYHQLFVEKIQVSELIYVNVGLMTVSYLNLSKNIIYKHHMDVFTKSVRAQSHVEENRVIEEQGNRIQPMRHSPSVHAIISKTFLPIGKFSTRGLIIYT